MSPEVIFDLERFPLSEELQRPREFYRRMAELHTHEQESPAPFPTIEEMIREDRDR
jgi:hypothetical protein